MSVETLRASASSRWMFCSGSVGLEANLPNVDNQSSLEGTAAHEMAEKTLKGEVSHPADLVNTLAANNIVMTPEMVEPVLTYVNFINSHNTAYWVEKFVELPGTPVKGTNDSSIFNFDDINGILRGNDFKYGFGPVDIFENWQMLIYMICLVLELQNQGKTVRTIIMSIIQPRGHHHDGPIRSWTITVEQLRDYHNQLIERVNLIVSGDQTCVSGSHCRYCKALAYCDVAKAASMNAVDVIGDNLPDTETPQEIADLLRVLKRAEDMVKHTKSAVTMRAESMISKGQQIPGFAVVPGTGHRKFNDEKAAIVTAKCFGIDLTEPKIVTPAEAERRGLKRSIIDTMAFSPSTAPRLIEHDASHEINEAFKK